MLLQLGLTAGIAGPSRAGEFILPLDATEKLPKGQLQAHPVYATSLGSTSPSDFVLLHFILLLLLVQDTKI